MLTCDLPVYQCLQFTSILCQVGSESRRAAKANRLREGNMNGRYENTERRALAVAEKGIKYMGMGVSGGEEGARNGVT